MNTITQWEQIPTLPTPQEEVQFWSNHALSVDLMKGAIQKNDLREIAILTLRMDPRMVARIKRLAGSRYLDYHHMILQWLAERLEKEMDQ